MGWGWFGEVAVGGGKPLLGPWETWCLPRCSGANFGIFTLDVVACLVLKITEFEKGFRDV